MQRTSDLINPPVATGFVAKHGDGYLLQRLGPVFELDSRRLTALRDWIAATIAVSSQQFTAFGVSLTDTWFSLMVLFAGTAIFVSSTVYARLAAPKFFKVEQAMMLLAWGTIALLVYAAGGSDSPYIFFYAQTMFYSAYFFGSSALALGHIALGSIFALAPIVYDHDSALHNNFIPTIAIALAVWWSMAALVALKHRVTLRAERDARRLSLSDPLTGAANLRALEDFVASLDGRRYAVAMVDLDGLRATNARDGYFAGDDLLRRAAGTLRDASRTSDQVARIGGDEFLIVMPGVDLDGAERWRSRFTERIAIANNAATSGVRISASVGLGASTGGLDSLSDVISSADRAMYAGKGPEIHEPEELIAPHARAQRLAARISTEEQPSRMWELANLKAPAGIFVSLLAASLTGLVIHWTGGSTSVLVSLVLVVGAYFAYFGDLRETIVGVGATLVAFAVAAFGFGSVTNIEQARFSTIVFGTIVIAYALQSNGRKLAVAEHRAEQLSLTDALTGLPNRRAFDRAFGEAVAQATASPRQSADAFKGNPGLILVNLENFKQVNTVLGHRGGDELLCEVTDALRDTVGEDGTTFRIGGDEFAVVVFAHHVQRVEMIATRCFEAIRDLDADGHYIAKMVAIGALIGHSYWRPGASVEELLDLAFAMMEPEAGRLRANAN